MHLSYQAFRRLLALGILGIALLPGCTAADPDPTVAPTPPARATATANDPAPSPVPLAQVATATLTPLPAPTVAQPTAASPTKVIPVAPEPGSRAPDLALTGVDGQVVHLSDFVGKRVLLNFWTTW
jgi:hypothetical protein